MDSYIAFFAAIRHSEIDYIEQVIQEYQSCTAYVIGMEISLSAHMDTSGQHIHFFSNMNDKDYHLFAQRVFKTKYGLRGQAKKDLPRQYGKVREIHNLTRMAAYTVKDQNIRSNIDPKIIQSWVSQSFKQQDKKELKDKLFNYMDQEYAMTHDILQLRLSILEYFRQTKISVTKPSILRYLYDYLLQRTEIPIEQVDQFIF